MGGLSSLQPAGLLQPSDPEHTMLMQVPVAKMPWNPQQVPKRSSYTAMLGDRLCPLYPCPATEAW
jgi:hypothetical protein